MDVLSHADGSAQAVREAAASGSDEARLALERELDRLNATLHAHATGLSQHLNGLLFSQALLLTAYLVVLVGGWSVPLPGKQGLLAAIVAYGAASLTLGYLILRSGRDRIAPLRQSRRVVEQALERVAGRPPAFSRERRLVFGIAAWSSRVLAVVIVSGWAALMLYTLALPLPDARAVAGRDARGEARSASTIPAAVAPATLTPAATRRPTTGPARKGEEPALPVAPVMPPAETAATPTATTSNTDSGLAALFRRALSAPAENVPAEKP